MNNWFKSSLFLLFLSPLISYAQTEISIPKDLTQTLTELKSSTEQLDQSNQALVLKNSQLKTRIQTAQTMLDKLVQENLGLMETKTKSEGPDPVRVKQVEQLQKNVVDLDSQARALTGQVETIQKTFTDLQKEDQELDVKTQQLLNPSAVEAPKVPVVDPGEVAEQRQKQRLAVLKLINESQVQQGLLQEQIIDAQKNMPQEVVMSAQGNAEALQGQIQHIQEQIAVLKASKTNMPQEDWDKQLAQLQANIDTLQRNQTELQSLAAQMKEKAKSMPVSKDDKGDEAQLQDNVERLKKEAKGLKFDLRELQEEMVKLDKQKADLEVLVK